MQTTPSAPASKWPDLDMMIDPRRWPRFPLLPLRRRTSGDYLGQLGFLCFTSEAYSQFPRTANPRSPITVYVGNILMATPQTLRLLPKIDYADFHELLANGWQVD